MTYAPAVAAPEAAPASAAYHEVGETQKNDIDVGERGGRIQFDEKRCFKCSASYDLPRGCSSWRCGNCGQFNTLNPGYDDECPCCVLS